MGQRPDEATVTVDVKPERDVPPWAVGPGERLGRYEVAGELGRGGMGVVYRAHDPVLDREVALKLVLHADADVGEQSRLLREAQAMAQLSHPNVVSVFHIESLPEHGVVLAMELVEGTDLRKWLDAERTPAEILPAFANAGRGLAAAHDTGLLHRDFKPANVLVRDDDGRVQVTDFGLARSADSEDPSVPAAPGANPEQSEQSGSVTRTGQVLGTPRYMAPEQHRGDKELTPAADQYAFCVALWHALVGAPPFTGEGMAAAKMTGPPPWPAVRGIPTRVGAAIRRGLAPKPEDRWPGMPALLAAIELAPRRRRQWLAGAAAIAVVGLGSWLLGSTQEVRQCTGAEAQWEGTWDEARKDELRSAFAAVDLPYAAATWERTAATVDDYTAQWSQMYTEACETAGGSDADASRVLDLRMKCLHRAKAQVKSMVDLLGDADTEMVQRAHVLTGGLRPLVRCTDAEALHDEVEPPLPHEAEAVAAIEAQLVASRTAFNAGRLDEARDKLDEARARANQVEYEPVRTGIELAHAGILEAYGDFAGSEAAYEEALRLASGWQQREQMAMAAAHLAHIVGTKQLRTEDAKRYVEMARDVEIDDPLVDAWRTRLLAGVAHSSGDYVEAEGLYREALTLESKLLGPSDHRVAATRLRVALAMGDQGRYAEAEAENRAALEIVERILGRQHPTALGGLNNLAIVVELQGRVEEAEAIHREILGQIISVFGPGHPDESDTRNNLAAVLENQGRLDEALAEHRHALSIREEALGPRHADVGVSHLNIASILGRQGEYAESEKESRLALEVLEPVLGPDHPHVASTYMNVAKTLLERDQFERARDPARTSWELHKGGDLPPHYKAEAAMIYADALWDSHVDADDHRRARELAQQAFELCDKDEHAPPACVDFAETWLREHPASP